MGRGALFLVAMLLGILALTVVLAVIMWTSTEGPVTISLRGFIALGLGALGTAVVGGGLMALVFISNRSGHDQAVHDEARTRMPEDGGPF